MKRLIFILCLLSTSSLFAQGILGGHVTGNIQLDMQMSKEDSTIGAKDVPEKFLMNARADVLYTNGGFTAGLRFEAYQNPLLGFDPNYKGQGLANYFVGYSTDKLNITAGNFYEQFGSGLILRSYEDRYLGYDNSLFGFSVNYRPVAGVVLKGVLGRQRDCWTYGTGVVRGIDGEVNLNSIISSFAESPLRVTLGGGFVSKYQDDESIFTADGGYSLNLPLNVGAGSARLDIGYKNWNLQVEYARKGQDPNVLNDYIYRYGEALMINASYSRKGFSANIQAKRVDNMGFKSERSATDANGARLYVNYIPSITKQHTYSLLSMYTYATQAIGEMGLQGDVMWAISKGTDIHINSAIITDLQKDVLGSRGSKGYNSDFFKTGDLYYGDASLEVSHKFSPKVKLVATYAYQVFNPEIEGHHESLHHNNVIVGDLTWKIDKKNVLRFEAEWLGSDSKCENINIDDKRNGDWIMGLVEYNFTSRWFVSLSDQYCYNDGKGNYYNIGIGYTHGATRAQIGYGKQREGLICIGGVCRTVPASNGLTFSLTTSF